MRAGSSICRKAGRQPEKVRSRPQPQHHKSSLDCLNEPHFGEGKQNQLWRRCPRPNQRGFAARSFTCEDLHSILLSVLLHEPLHWLHPPCGSTIRSVKMVKVFEYLAMLDRNKLFSLSTKRDCGLEQAAQPLGLKVKPHYRDVEAGRALLK